MPRLIFAGGTLVAHGLLPESAAASPDFVWDPRIAAYRAPAYRYRALRLAFSRAGEDFADSVLHLTKRASRWSDVELRPYQRSAVLAWRAAGRRGIVALPTGSGKTRLACAVMAGCEAPSLCLVPTRVLLHQWRNELARHYRGEVGCLGDGERNIEHVTVATFESAYRWMRDIGHRFGQLIVDEAHHFGAGLRDEALEMCAAPLRLGLTATAPGDAQLARLSDLLGPVVFQLTAGDLTGEWLADFDVVALRLPLTDEERARYDQAVAIFRPVHRMFTQVSPGASWRDFVATAQRSEAGRAALAAYRVSRRLTHYTRAKAAAVARLLAEHRTSRVLVFTPDNDTAYAIARQHLVMPITCDIGRAERDEAIAAFRSGMLRVLVSARVLNEGFDVPDADVAIIVGGTLGEREHVQRVGRVLRPSAGKRALVFELIAAETHEVYKAEERARALEPSAA
jgi:superfamily II DNA or RNA helicase